MKIKNFTSIIVIVMILTILLFLVINKNAVKTLPTNHTRPDLPASSTQNGSHKSLLSTNIKPTTNEVINDPSDVDKELIRTAKITGSIRDSGGKWLNLFRKDTNVQEYFIGYFVTAKVISGIIDAETTFKVMRDPTICPTFCHGSSVTQSNGSFTMELNYKMKNKDDKDTLLIYVGPFGYAGQITENGNSTMYYPHTPFSEFHTDIQSITLNKQDQTIDLLFLQKPTGTLCIEPFPEMKATENYIAVTLQPEGNLNTTADLAAKYIQYKGAKIEIPSGMSFTLIFERKGYEDVVEVLEPLGLKEERRVPVNMHKSQCSFKGRVLNYDGSPMKNIFVDLWQGKVNYSAQTDNDGNFEINEIKNSKIDRIALSCTTNILYKQLIFSDIKQDPQSYIISLEKAGDLKLTGRCVNSGGQPMKGVMVRAFVKQYSLYTTTNSFGEFVLDGLTEDKLTINFAYTDPNPNINNDPNMIQSREKYKTLELKDVSPSDSLTATLD
ncbi:MAG: hypothetical protein HY606_15365 [Planctomycetes bacterium]|nr:hypothetical protein [Planctomycetota bacterium]